MIPPKKLGFGIFGVIIASLFFLLPPADGLNVEGMKVLGLFLMAVCWWVGDVFPDYVTAFWLMTLLILTNASSLTTVFSAYSGSIIWIVIPALAIGVGLAKSGLLRRLVLRILSLFKGGYASQVFAMLLAGNLINPLIPSMTAKVAIAAPLTKAYSEEMGFEPKSKPAAGLFSAMWSAFGTSGPLFLSGTFMAFLMIGLLPESYQAEWTYLSWFFALLPWAIVWFVLSYVFIRIFFSPKEKKPLSESYMKEQYAALGSMSRGELVCLAVLILCIALWITESFHGIPAAVVALLGMTILLSAKILDRESFRSGIAWDVVVFIACNISIGTVFTEAGVTAWIGKTFGHLLEPVFSNVFLVIVVSVLVIGLLRFVLVSQSATMTIFIIVTAPFAIAAGMHPFIPAVVCLVAVNLWNVKYQNTTMITAIAASGEMAKFSDVAKMSIVYMVSCVLGMICCVPVWMMMGLV